MRALPIAGLAFVLALAATGCGGAQETQGEASASPAPEWQSPLTQDDERRVLRLSPVPPVPDDPTNRVAGVESAAELGRHLFHSQKLSKGETTSCATCHDPRDSFVDGKPLADGVLPLERHTPTLWNVAHQRWFFWDGRADSLWAQALVPIEDPLEHAFTRVGVAKVVHESPVMRELYEQTFGPMPPFDDDARFPREARPVPPDDRAHHMAALQARRARIRAGKSVDDAEPGHHTHLYGTGFYHPHQRAWDGMTPEDQDAATLAFVNVGKAIAAFQTRIVSADSPFDRFVAALRDKDPDAAAALEPDALRGLKLFVGKAQCIVCHHGPVFSDYEFHDSRVPTEDTMALNSLAEGEVPVGGKPPEDLGRVHGIQRLRASEFGVASRWSDDPTGPSRVKVDYLPTHMHAGSPEFKTPTLRNVELTAPYMHNGAFETLEEVVHFYNTREGERRFGGQSEKILQPLGLSESEEADLVAFMRSLTDDSLPMGLVRAPR